MHARHSRPGDVVLSPRARPRQGLSRARRRSLLVLLPAALYILLLRLRGSERGGAEFLFLHRALSATDEAHDDDGERREPSLDPRGVDGVGAGDGFPRYHQRVHVAHRRRERKPRVEGSHV